MKLNEFLWWVAGADSERLQQCPSDQKRFGAIGMVILTTAFVAFLAGTAAAMFFTQKDGATSGQLGWSIAFGVLWAIIIFMIDRSLVVTMKKDPNKNNQFTTVAGPFIFRMFLAAIIALMISIPLELYIFDGFIGVKGMEFAAKEANEYAEITLETQRIHKIDSINNKDQGLIGENKSSIAQLDNTIDENNRKIADLKAQLNKPVTPRYNNAYQKLLDDKKRRNSAEAQLSIAVTSSDSAKIEEQIKRINNDIREDNKIISDEKRQWNNSVNAKIEAIQASTNQSITNRDNLNKEINIAKTRMAEQDSLRSVYSNFQEKNDADYKKKQSEANRFIRDYQILSNTINEKNADGSYAYPTELFFYWLIRLIFFLIELLPTLVKVITPVGVYDRLVYEEEKALNDYFQSEEYHNSVLAQQKANMQYEANMRKQRQGIEGNSQLEILKQASLAQNEIANEAINKWKQDELKKLYASPTQNTNSEPI